MRILSVLMLLSCTFLFSCKKDEGPSKTELLTDHCWKIATATSAPALNGASDIYATYKPCEKDNILCFSTGGTLTSDEGPLKCSAPDPQVTQGTWKLENEEKNFKITMSNGIIIDANLLELSSNVLKISFNATINATTYTFTQTFLPN